MKSTNWTLLIKSIKWILLIVLLIIPFIVPFIGEYIDSSVAKEQSFDDVGDFFGVGIMALFLGVIGLYLSFTQTDRKQAEEEREKLITELQIALAKVKQLEDFLPICSHCKKIRDKEGRWYQLERYITDHSNTEFSHGIRPDCVKRHYPDFNQDK